MIMSPTASVKQELPKLIKDKNTAQQRFNEILENGKFVIAFKDKETKERGVVDKEYGSLSDAKRDLPKLKNEHYSLNFFIFNNNGVFDEKGNCILSKDAKIKDNEPLTEEAND